jgi:enterochelin esterase-like enzyme
MKKNQKVKVLSILVILFLSIYGNVQAQRGTQVKSPEINSNNSVTFRLLAADANKVTLSGNWMTGNENQLEMTKDESGIWSFTTPVLPAEFYSYTFNVNGVKTLDPNNVQIVRDGTRFENYVIVPGDASNVYTVKNVPHGTLSKVWYPSPTLGKTRRLYVYTPPGYTESDKKYPVFYLLHGAGGDEDAWTTLGRTPYILDNLIAEEKADPMIVVMTNGNAGSAAAPGEEPIQGNTLPGFSQQAGGTFEQSLVNDVIPFIEKNFRTLNDKNHRAIAGLSMGGMHTQNITNNNPDMFGYIGVMSMGLMNNSRMAGNYNAETHKKQIEALKQSGLKLYWIGCGEEDFLYESVTTLRKLYDDLGFKYEYRESTGGHTWTNWRIYLTELAPKLFK